MNPKKAMRRFADIVLNAPAGAVLTVGVAYDEREKWRVMMAVPPGMLFVSAKTARGLAETFHKTSQHPEWRNISTGLEWLPKELSLLADECDQNNASGVMPPEVLAMAQEAGRA